LIHLRFIEVEKDNIINYLALRNRLHKKDSVDINCEMMILKAKIYANGLAENKNWNPSSGWLAKVLKRHHYNGLALHGEAGEIPVEERLKVMGIFNAQLAADIAKHKIGKLCLDNGDQTGLFYAKLPNRMYVKKGT
jgi:hypothetical protein